MDQLHQDGQILMELIAAVSIFALFIGVSLALYQDDQKASYKYMMSHAYQEKTP